MRTGTLTDSADCRMEFRLEGSRLRAWASGTSSFASTVSCWQRIVAEVRAHRPDTLLLVDELRGRGLTELEWESLVQATRGMGLENVRIAHVKPQGLETMEYCEIYSREVGLDARVFDDEAAAALWLRAT
jgi:hypothetical protein